MEKTDGIDFVKFRTFWDMFNIFYSNTHEIKKKCRNKIFKAKIVLKICYFTFSCRSFQKATKRQNFKGVQILIWMALHGDAMRKNIEKFYWKPESTKTKKKQTKQKNEESY